MAMAATDGRGVRSGMNVTPLIDVLLVLLIIFMVIQPTVERGLDALLPKPAPTRSGELNPQTLVIAVTGTTAEPVYALNQHQLALAELEPELRQIVQRTGQHALFVQGSNTLDYAAVTPVFDAARAAGADQIGVLTPATFQPQ